MAKLLEGKRVLITGASSGIGRELSIAFAREGAFLVLCSDPHTKDELQKCAELCKSEGAPGCETHCIDLADGPAVSRWAEECLSKHQAFDVLVNNAGVLGPAGEAQGPLQGNPDEWDRMLAINLKAPMRLTRALAPAMVDKGEGVIVNMADVEATHTGPRHPAYAASKHALRGFSKSCYEALRQHGIKVVTISPGNVEQTGMAREKAGGQGAVSPSDVVEAVLFVFRVSPNCVPEEINIKAVQPSQA